MKSSTFISAIICSALVLTAGTTLAGASERHERMSFETLDTDGDGQISRAEMDQRRLDRIEQADTNGDGALSLAELEARASERAKKHAERMMERQDANKDGILSGEELTAGPRADKRFSRVDADGSGTISQAEFDAAKGRIARMGHKNRSE